MLGVESLAPGRVVIRLVVQTGRRSSGGSSASCAPGSRPRSTRPGIALAVRVALTASPPPRWSDATVVVILHLPARGRARSASGSGSRRRGEARGADPRRGRHASDAEPRRPTAPPEPRRRSSPDPSPSVVVEEPVELEVEPPELRDRLGKTRGVFAARSRGPQGSTTRPGTSSRRRCCSPTSACRPPSGSSTT